jgi:hypothetical protein
MKYTEHINYWRIRRMGSIKIDAVDNGFILSYVKKSRLGQAPEQVVLVFHDIKEVIEILQKEF